MLKLSKLLICLLLFTGCETRISDEYPLVVSNIQANWVDGTRYSYKRFTVTLRSTASNIIYYSTNKEFNIGDTVHLNPKTK